MGLFVWPKSKWGVVDVARLLEINSLNSKFKKPLYFQNTYHQALAVKENFFLQDLTGF